jgi:ribosomal protein S18 acetylase RimI-like enzyme
MVNRCQQIDGYPIKLYWYILQKRLVNSEISDYLAYKNQQLVGSLHIFFFSEGIEIVALVKPAFRLQGVFKKMLSAAVQNLQNLGIEHCILVCHDANKRLNILFQNWGGLLKQSVFEWQAPTTFPELIEPHLEFQRADMNDMDMLIEINQQCFPLSIPEQIRQRFVNDLPEKNRQILLAKNRQNEIVGKLHVREEVSRVVLHDVGILKAFQRQGYGRSLMLTWLQQFAAQYAKPIIVEVLNDNGAALALYRSCGFTEINVYHYYEFSLQNLSRAIKK